jgi:5-methylcytosine-specific restriction endonuclease McrA
MTERDLPKSADAARGLGAGRYFTGRPCKRGHVAWRLTRNETCSDCAAIAAANAYHRRPDAVIERAARWSADNPERRREIRNRWRDKNPEKAKAAERDSRKRNAATRQRWLEGNRDRVRALKRNRKAMMRGAEGRHTTSDVAAIRSAQKDRCAYCRNKLCGKGHVDHITALSKGGSNSPSNLQLTCDSCNLSKRSKDPIVFAQTRGFLL